MSSPTSINIPLPFDQLVELIKGLPKHEKLQLMDVLEQDATADIPAWQKQEVRKRIKKYSKNPELLIDEKQALKMITQL
jgi:hypothetical protein